jgi:hypothetical protein
MTDLSNASPTTLDQAGLDQAGPDQAGLFAMLHALESGNEPSAEMQLLQWVMSLPAGLDPAVAAQSVLSYQRDYSQYTLSRRLLRLLEIVGEFPAERLAALARRRRHPVLSNIGRN